jgi:hypothetical protein
MKQLFIFMLWCFSVAVQAATAFQVNGDGTVTQSLYGLMWQQQDDGVERNWANAQSHCEALSLAGHEDWRLPTPNELVSIVDYARSDLNIDQTVFLKTQSAGYWSGIPHAVHSDDAWIVYFYGGGVASTRKDYTGYTRCVRAGVRSDSSTTLLISLQNNGDGTVSDNQGLMWQQGDAGQARSFAQAQSYCDNLGLADKTDWVLPNISQLHSLVDYYSQQPALSPLFPDTQFLGDLYNLGGYWSATPSAVDSERAWFASFRDGYVELGHKGNTNYVRCVRARSEPTPQPQPQPQPQPKPQPTDSIGKAIIITASGAYEGNSLFPRSEELTRKMYQTLSQRGFSHADIVWLNPKTWQDVDGDGKDDAVVDNDLFDPANALTQAFQQASQLGAGQQFVFFVHGHAQQNKLKITRDYWLEARQLRDLLAQVPASITQLLIFDTCFSGSFLDELAAKNRIILTASDANSSAWNSKNDSFSEPLIKGLRRNQNISQAFESAEDYILGNARIFGEQKPQLDDDADGQFTSKDGLLARQVYLGKEGARAADIAEILQVHPVINLGAEQADAVLWVKTSPTGAEIKTVRALLIFPGVQAQTYQGEQTDFGRIELPLVYNAAQDRFEGAYNQFAQAGLWQISYEAQGLDGSWSDKIMGEVQATGVNKAVSLQPQVNRSRYATGDKFHFSLVVNPLKAGRYDLYVAVIFPAGYFVTIAYPFNLSFPDVIQAYKTDLALSNKETFNIMEFSLPAGLKTGAYQVCTVITATGAPAQKVENWLDVQCQGFTLTEI